MAARVASGFCGSASAPTIRCRPASSFGPTPARTAANSPFHTALAGRGSPHARAGQAAGSCFTQLGSLVIRKIFQNKDVVSNEHFRELERMWNKDECCNVEHEEELQKCMTSLLHDCLLPEGVHQDDESRPGKRKRTSAPDGGSEVWLYFTKICTADPNRVYAVCHCCDRGYKGHSKNGTSSLWRHKQTCSTKHPELPRQNEAGSVNGVDAIWEPEVWAFAVLRQL